MTSKSLIKSVVFFILSLLALTTSFFAWLSISNEGSIGRIDAALADYSANISFEVKKNDAQDYQIINTITDMHAAFGYTLPGDELHFKITVINDGTKDFNVDIEIKNILSKFQQNHEIHDENYEANMLDAYYLVNGKVDYIVTNGSTSVVKKTDFIPGTSGKLFENTSYEMTLSPFRLSSLVNQYHSLFLINKEPLSVGSTLVAEFTIAYNIDATYPDYQFGELYMNSIYVYLI